MNLHHGWSLDKNNWEELEQQLENTEWHSTRLHEDYMDSVPNLPGVYTLTTRPLALQYISDNAKVDPIGFLYVGETQDLQKRFLDHVRAKKDLGNPSKNIAQCKETFHRLEFHWTSFYTRGEDSLAFITRLERSLIQTLRPPANIQSFPPVIQAKLGTKIPVPTYN